MCMHDRKCIGTSKIESLSVFEREYVCVCVNELMRERMCVCVCVYVCVCIYVCVRVRDLENRAFTSCNRALLPETSSGHRMIPLPSADSYVPTYKYTRTYVHTSTCSHSTQLRIDLSLYEHILF